MKATLVPGVVTAMSSFEANRLELRSDFAD